MIDEKKLIAEIREYIDEYKELDMQGIHNLKWCAMMEALELVESQPKVGEWIPCSERLPGEEAEQYIRDVYNGKGSLYPCLVTYKIPNHERISIGKFYYDIDEKCFINHEGRKETNCLAWMPLPEMKRHEIKILPEYFAPVSVGEKRFELRKNDRDYHAGDSVTMKEWDGTEYTGNEITVEIKYVLKDCPEYGLMDGYCIFGW